MSGQRIPESGELASHVSHETSFWESRAQVRAVRHLLSSLASALSVSFPHLELGSPRHPAPGSASQKTWPVAPQEYTVSPQVKGSLIEIESPAARCRDG